MHAPVIRPAVLIPALDEVGCIAAVVRGFLELQADGGRLVDEVVVVDNGSTDGTAEAARAAGATVVAQPQRGYGRACKRGLAYLAERAAGPPQVVALADGDGSAEPTELPALLAPIASGEADFVLGSRTRLAAPGSVTPQQRFGNGLAAFLIRRLYGQTFTDLAPFRAIRWPALVALGMEDDTYGWSIEMQVKACKHGLKIREVDVHNHPRTSGVSKVSGTLRGTLGAGRKIIGTIWRYR